MIINTLMSVQLKYKHISIHIAYRQEVQNMLVAIALLRASYHIIYTRRRRQVCLSVYKYHTHYVDDLKRGYLNLFRRHIDRFVTQINSNSFRRHLITKERVLQLFGWCRCWFFLLCSLYVLLIRAQVRSCHGKQRNSEGKRTHTEGEKWFIECGIEEWLCSGLADGIPWF